MTQRLCAAALLHPGRTVIRGWGASADERAALRIAEQLGARVSYLPDGIIEIAGNGHPSGSSIDCGESGLCARLFTPIASLSAGAIRVDGHGSLLRRDMQAFSAFLPQLGVRLHDFSGRLPFTVQGPLQPADLTLDGSEGSQYLTGLLFALAFSAKRKITVTVGNLKSRPYAGMTMDVLRRFGKVIAHDNYERFIIDPALFRETEYEMTADVARDWSAAAVWFVAGAIGGRIGIAGLSDDPSQADHAICRVVQQAGASVSREGNVYTVAPRDLRAFRFDATDCPDLFPALAVLAACCTGTSALQGTERLANKESDRAQAISGLLAILGVPHRLAHDTLYVEGVRTFRGGTVSAHNDHRIVMAAAIAAVRARGPVVIEGAEAISKSYPAFFEDLQSLQLQCTLTPSP